MRTIKQTGQFKRDLKREAKGQHRAMLDADLMSVLTALGNDQPLEPRHRDHALTGDWKDHRDCHVKPDLVLVYQQPDDATLRLVRLGSHGELGLHHKRGQTTIFLTDTKADTKGDRHKRGQTQKGTDTKERHKRGQTTIFLTV